MKNNDRKEKLLPYTEPYNTNSLAGVPDYDDNLN